MFNLVKSGIDTQKIHNLDFDIEAGQLGNTALNTDRKLVWRARQALAGSPFRPLPASQLVTGFTLSRKPRGTR